MLRKIPILLMLLGLPAAAQDIMSPSEFREYAEGYTLYFEQDGVHFGIEQFGPDNRTTWQFRDGSCVTGAWKPHGAQICFYYGDGAEVLCWRMLRDGRSLIARLLNTEDEGLELRITRRDQAPVLCGGGPGADL